MSGFGELQLARRVAGARLSERAVSETIGICRGLIFDGTVDYGEAKLLLDWMERNEATARNWPFDMVFLRLKEMLADGVLDLDEQQELLEMLMQLTGNGTADAPGFISNSTTLPLDRPQPQVVWEGRGFVFTGQMACGSRRECQDLVTSLGGTSLPGVSGKTHYLVIGAVGSEAWIHSTHGRKIEDAVSRKKAGQDLSILSEDHWVASLRAKLGEDPF